MIESNPLKRRTFLKTTAAAGLLITTPKIAFGAAANERLRLGIVGSGGRGAWIGNLFQENSNTKVVALHDYFQDRVDAAGERLDVPAERRYVGLDGYRELVASDVDAVAVESPPYFHPEQAVAALEAGKHLYLAKPIAVDVPGCLAIVEAAKKAEGKLTALVDFQTRNDPLFREAAKRIHEGMIGDIACGQNFYHTGALKPKTAPGTEVARLRNWYFDIALSGDIIVEQNIHVIDVMNWFLQGNPVSASGVAGRKVRLEGDCNDHFVVTYTYPNDVLVDFGSSQFLYGFHDMCMRVYGSLGTADTHYGGKVEIKGKSDVWEGGETTQIYQQGAVNNIKDFCQSIADGKYLNNTRESADSTMASILGRMAAKAGRPVTWDEMVAANEKLEPNLDLPADGPSIMMQ